MNRDKRILFTKFRIGVCPLRIETGRYENVGVRKGILPHERTCLVCGGQDIEDEYHFLLKCPKYSTRRLHLLDVVQDVCKLSEGQMRARLEDRSQLFTSIMQCQDKKIIHAVSDFIWDAYRIREQIMLNGNYVNEM